MSELVIEISGGCLCAALALAMIAVNVAEGFTKQSDAGNAIMGLAGSLFVVATILGFSHL